MKENMLDVLMYLFEHYINEESEVSPDHDSLKIRLEEAGFSQGEIGKAFRWLSDLSDQREAGALGQKEIQSTPGMMRVYSPSELERLETESRGFLLFLEQTNVLTPITRELIIERALALETSTIDIDDMKWVVLMVLFNQPGQEAAYSWVEDIVFDSMETTLH